MSKYEPRALPVKSARQQDGASRLSSQQLLVHLDRRFRSPLLSFFLRRCHNKAEAEDLTQEVFVRLLRHDAAIQQLDAFVFTIAANILRDRTRRLQARRHFDFVDVTSLIAAPHQPADLIDTLDPERVLNGRRSLAEVVAALQLLGERTRDIFILSRIEHLKHSEIAAKMGLSVSAVEKHVARALAHLACCLG